MALKFAVLQLQFAYFLSPNAFGLLAVVVADEVTMPEALYLSPSSSSSSPVVGCDDRKFNYYLSSIQTTGNCIFYDVHFTLEPSGEICHKHRTNLYSSNDTTIIMTDSPENAE